MEIIYTRLLLMTLAVCTPFTVSAEIYKWVDENGVAHFTDKPPVDKKVEEVDLKINTYKSVEVKPLVERLGKKDKVVMYSTAWCGVCKKAKRYFRKNNIPYVTYDVEKSRVGRMDFKRLRGKSVPIIIIGNKRMNGFTVSRFEKIYKRFKKQQEKDMDKATEVAAQPEAEKKGWFERFMNTINKK